MKNESKVPKAAVPWMDTGRGSTPLDDCVEMLAWSKKKKMFQRLQLVSLFMTTVLAEFLTKLDFELNLI